jgi:hypothetical protein
VSAEHPSSVELERVALGEGSELARSHVRNCEACRAYVSEFEEGARAFAKTRNADAFMDAVERRAAEKRASLRPMARLVRTRMLWAAAPLAAAAVLLLLFRPVRTLPVGESTGDPPTRVESPLVETTFKGGFALAVVRENRGGLQERVVGDVEVHPFDRLRLEVSLEGEAPIAAGALGDDGTWVPLIAPAVLDAGTHFSEFAVRFDEAPTSGVILVGAPGAVERARTTRELSGVRVLRLHPKQ